MLRGSDHTEGNAISKQGMVLLSRQKKPKKGHPKLSPERRSSVGTKSRRDSVSPKVPSERDPNSPGFGEVGHREPEESHGEECWLQEQRAAGSVPVSSVVLLACLPNELDTSLAGTELHSLPALPCCRTAEPELMSSCTHSSTQGTGELPCAPAL